MMPLEDLVVGQGARSDEAHGRRQLKATNTSDAQAKFMWRALSGGDELPEAIANGVFLETTDLTATQVAARVTGQRVQPEQDCVHTQHHGAHGHPETPARAD